MIKDKFSNFLIREVASKMEYESTIIQSNLQIDNYNALPDSILGLFSKISIQRFPNGKLNLEMKQGIEHESVLRKKIDNLFNLLYNILGHDSNEVSLKNYPSMKFLNTEYYCWYLNKQGKVINEDEGIFYGIEYFIYSNSVSLSLIDIHNVSREFYKKQPNLK
jgi:hypothetical protein